MSLNHLTSDFSQTHWWSQSQQHDMIFRDSNSSSNISGLKFDLNNEEDEETVVQDEAVEEEYGHEIPKIPLFEKPLTPSDVGKLNRLVIPKQHAEKYFPMNGVTESCEKGLLLSFEDELGKVWRFRYSYWNSSQSYVLTKGWSRFVKEKKLDAGDIVQFERHRHHCERLFIGWRRRRSVGSAAQPPGVVIVNGGSGVWQPHLPQPHGPPALPYPVHAAAVQSKTITASGNCKRLRLFGVNMECQPEAPDSGSSNQGPDPDPGPANYNYYPKLHANYDNPSHMDVVDYTRDISHSRYQQG